MKFVEELQDHKGNDDDERLLATKAKRKQNEISRVEKKIKTEPSSKTSLVATLLESKISQRRAEAANAKKLTKNKSVKSPSSSGVGNEDKAPKKHTLLLLSPSLAAVVDCTHETRFQVGIFL